MAQGPLKAISVQTLPAIWPACPRSPGSDLDPQSPLASAEPRSPGSGFCRCQRTGRRRNTTAALPEGPTRRSVTCVYALQDQLAETTGTSRDGGPSSPSDRRNIQARPSGARRDTRARTWWCAGSPAVPLREPQPQLREALWARGDASPMLVRPPSARSSIG